MRRIAAFAVSVLALAACSPSAPGGASSGGQAGGGLFPNLSSASYRAEANITREDGTVMPMVMIRDGRRLRLEMASAEGQTTIINNGDAGDSFMISTVGGRTTALRTAATTGAFEDPAQSWQSELAATATRSGACVGAGQSGTQWQRTEDGVVRTACVTDDGIILAATEGGRTVWETTSVQRGAQDAALFALPPGVEAIDMSNAAAALQRAGAGK